VLTAERRVQTWRPVTFVRHIVSSAPGLVDLLTLLEVLRSRCKPNETVLELTQRHIKSSLTPRVDQVSS
jgi:hypothetical protein